MSEQPSHRWIADAQGLAELVEALERAPIHALDTESNSGFAYRERLCLLQVEVGDTVWLVDMVALTAAGLSPEPLRGPLESRNRRTLLHGGEFDVGCLKRDHGIGLRGIWDTQQAAIFLGWEKTGYGSLVERVCGVGLDKGHAHFDWGRRPLPREALTYAMADVLYLERLQRHLAAAVAAADLEEEVEIACRAVEQAEWNGGFDGSDPWRVKGAHTLPPEALPTLTALCAWRDRLAQRLDRPPGRVLNDRLLLALSKRRPSHREELRRMGLGGRRLAELGPELLRVLEQARRDPPAVPDPVSSREAFDPRGAARSKRLRRWRGQEAARRGVQPVVVLPAPALRYLARCGAADLEAVPQLGAKRIGKYGARLRELCGG